MTKIIEILNFEEGFRSRPYLDSLGYPTVGVGFLIGPKGSPLSNYTFTLPQEASDAWLDSLVKSKRAEMERNALISSALTKCNDARTDIITSMAYNMGVAGLALFKNTLGMVASGDFNGAADGMLNSKWARQVSARANRHAQVMRSGTYDAYKGLI